MMNTPDQALLHELDKVPVEHRRTIARWLADKGAMYGRCGKSLVDPDGTRAVALADAFKGAAVDLMTPLAEDTTVEHANGVLADLAR